MNSAKTKYLLALLLLAALTGSFLGGWYARGKRADGCRSRSVRLGQYRLTNPLLTCEIAPGEMSGNLLLTTLKERLENLIATQVKTGMADAISVYFSDLNNDNTIEINGDYGFEPASLIKLPLMMEYFKRAESDPQLLQRRLIYDGKQDWTRDQNYKPANTLESGKSYRADDLIFRMITHSDNNAFRTLLTQSDRDYLQAIHNNLGVEVVADASGAKLVTARSYAIFMKTLYNASFLNQAMSEKALQYLLANDFHLGIDATIPDSIPVASKFGERTTGTNNETKQLHDYGIVYYPQRPYLICIMTRGKDFAALAQAIRQVSQLVFTEFDAKYNSLKK